MSDETIFINRELSWLDFNRRVLALGKDKNVPLAEQVKFLAIYGSNLDEFFMVRVGSLQERANLEQSKSKKEKRENKTNMTAAEQLAAIMPKTADLQQQCDKIVVKLRQHLAEQGYVRIDFQNLTKEDERFWKKYFLNEMLPVLSPQIIDHRHPFPFLRNQESMLHFLPAKTDSYPGTARSSPEPGRYKPSPFFSLLRSGCCPPKAPLRCRSSAQTPEVCEKLPLSGNAPAHRFRHTAPPAR